MLNNEEKEYEYVILDDNEKYIILKTIEEDNKYIYLSSVKDVTDFLIQKIVVKDGVEYIVNLDNDEEFDLALKLFNNN